MWLDYPDDLARGIRQILEDPALAQRLSAAGRESYAGWSDDATAHLSRHLLGNDDSFVVADRGFPAHWGAQPGLFRTCTTARSRVATLDGGSTPPSAWPPRVVRAHRHRSNDAPRAAKRVVSKNTNVLPSPSCPKTRTEPKARILEALSKFAETSRRGTGSAIGEPEQSFPPEYPFRPASAPIRRLVPPAGTSRR